MSDGTVISHAAVRLKAVSKIYGRGPTARTALGAIDVRIPPGTFTAVMGPSGSGKSTFLQCASGLIRPTSGTVYLGEASLAGLNETQLTELRRVHAGFVFQNFNLVPALNVMHNVALPLRLAGARVDKTLLSELIARVGLSDHVGKRPSRLSGGQQQRVAIARALVTRPEVVFADEPTGALDLRTAQEILQLLRESVDGLQQTVVMVTHDPVAASYADSVLFLADGELAGSMIRPSPAQIAEYVLGIEHRP